ncbi:putative tetratricopeptide-like helical domain-containing protein [Rosa chinensis]|uniref:Putative tetratricopeptide-like helical domain-containing protein n=1 Tax=Rosa chinensis TaxID=74649 RepID=A0A2P6RN35_ROSCH|nr:pentatricopeptide repeat-containing protein At3g50420 [Rosa chinensis]PRQ47814.1 putative tetratricopeptide-like helical domain-containing protein [Rosa chinensis]
MPPLCEPSLVAALIQKCTAINSLREARRLHALLLTTTTIASRSVFLYNNVLSMYARCGSLGDARKVFEEMPQRSLVSFNALAAAYSRSSDTAGLALTLLKPMGVECLMPNVSTFTSVIQASCTLEDWLVGSLVHAQVVKCGFLNDVYLQTALLGMYSSCGDLVSASRVFGGMVDRDVVAWNSMIFGYLKNGKNKEGLRLFDGMLRTGVIPTQFTYSMVLNVCSRLRYLNLGKIIHARVIVSSTQADLALENSLLDMYCNSGDTQAAFSVFNKMDSPDLVSWNTMIAGYSENEDGEKAMNLFARLKRLCYLKPDEYTYAAIISAAGTYLATDYGKLLHAQVIKVGLEKSIFVGTALVSMYFKNSETDSAQKAFYSISEKDVILWTEMIMGYSRLADGESAIKFFKEMCKESHKVDSFALSGALSACSDLAMLKQGEMIHSQALKTGFDVEMSVCGSLVDMYAKNGCLESAYCIFSQVLEPDLKCWNSMLGGYSQHGMAEEALKLFFEIQKHGLVPDQVTFLSLLSACNHSGLVEVGKFLWNCMKENGIPPGPKHCSCMVSLLSRARLLNEAEELIIKSPFNEDNLELWRTLLSSCVIHKNLEIGVHAAEQVLKVDAEDSATHILLSNLYAAAGKWDKVVEIRRKIKELTLEKDPGLSWIEDKKNIQVFSSGVQSKEEVGEAEDALHWLQGNMVRSQRDELDEPIYTT